MMAEQQQETGTGMRKLWQGKALLVPQACYNSPSMCLESPLLVICPVRTLIVTVNIVGNMN